MINNEEPVIISHRGNLEGPTNNTTENKPETIEHVLSLGFDCEIDVRMINGVLWLGHDTPEFIVQESFLLQKGLWLHAKNIEALQYFSSSYNFKYVNFFWHQNDDYTLCSQGQIWTYPGKQIANNSILVLPENTSYIYQKQDLMQIRGVCTDYPLDFKKIMVEQP